MINSYWFQNYIQFFKKSFVYSGRASRREFWYDVLITTVLQILLSIFFIIKIIELYRQLPGLVETSDMSVILEMFKYATKLSIPGQIFGLVTMFPLFAVLFRRLHDIGRSGWWHLWIFVPILGTIVLIYLLVLPSQPGPNKYGPNPYTPHSGHETAPLAPGR